MEGQEDHNEGKKRGVVELIEEGVGPEDPLFAISHHIGSIT